MQVVTYDVPCEECKAVRKIQVNLWNGEHKLLKTKTVGSWTYGQKWAVVSRYKELKGFTRELFPNWDVKNRGRFLKVAGNLLDRFASLADPVAIAIEALEATHEAASDPRSGGWNWTLETVDKRADEWLAKKQKGAQR